MKKYKYRLKHDNGIIYLTTIASSEEEALTKVVEAEGCPKSAPELIEVTRLKGNEQFKTIRRNIENRN